MTLFVDLVGKKIKTCQNTTQRGIRVISHSEDHVFNITYASSWKEHSGSENWVVL